MDKWRSEDLKICKDAVEKAAQDTAAQERVTDEASRAYFENADLSRSEDLHRDWKAKMARLMGLQVVEISMRKMYQAALESAVAALDRSEG
jgi:transposase